MLNNLNKIQAGINKIEDDNQKMIFQYKLNKLYNDYNLKIEEILVENINYFDDFNQMEIKKIISDLISELDINNAA